MLVVRGTKKLRDRVKAPVAAAGDESTTVLGDWFATALFWRPQVALLVNQRTFIPVFVPLAPAASLLDRAPDAIAEVLRRHGAGASWIDAELGAMREARLAPTNNRSVVGVMNEFAFHGGLRWEEGIGSLEDLAVDLAGMPIGPLYGRSGFPDRELAAVLGIELAGRRRLRLVGGRATTPSTAAAPQVFQLKITLKETKPPIWRRVLVDGSSTLDQLHEVIQAAFGWWNYHLYEFEFGRTCYGLPDPDGFDYGPPARDARKTRLEQVAGEGSSFKYTYDFGDNWQHKLIVEKVLDAAPVPTLPACIDGGRAGPPEDCGGAWGYEELRRILADPSHPEHAERAEWASAWTDADFGADAFDPGEFADNLTMLRRTKFDD